MDFNGSPLDRLSRQLLKCRKSITTIFVFSFVVRNKIKFVATLCSTLVSLEFVTTISS